MQKTTLEKYYDAVKFLESLGNITNWGPSKLGKSIYLKRMRYLLSLLGNPEKAFKYIHVTGTSGKGSVSAMTHSILNTAGFMSGVYFSPHTTTSIERIRVNGKYIPPKEFVELLEYLKPYMEKVYFDTPLGFPGYAETFLAIALLYFKKLGIEYIVLEVHRGGKYDPTNIIEKPEIAIITNVDLDHINFLGPTKKDIAIHKAGIIKEGCTVITGEKVSKIRRIFEKKAKKFRNEFIYINKIKNELLELLPEELPLKGEHQIQNALIAASAAKKLGIEKEIIQHGIKNTRFPCRMEILQKEPLVIADGAHNPAKIKALRRSLQNLLPRFQTKNTWIIIGINENKDYKKMLKEISPLGDHFLLSRHLEGRKCVEFKKMAKVISDLKPEAPISIFFDPYRALSFALENANKDDLILITGSLYLAGELRKHWVSETKILATLRS